MLAASGGAQILLPGLLAAAQAGTITATGGDAESDQQYPLAGLTQARPLAGALQAWALAGQQEQRPLAGQQQAWPLAGQRQTYPME